MIDKYVKDFKGFVLKHLARAAKKYEMPIDRLFLQFYLGELKDSTDGERFVGFSTGRGLVVPQYAITNVFEGERCYMEANRNEATEEYEYEWSYGAHNAATYDTEDKANQVLKALGLTGSEVVHVGDTIDLEGWKRDPIGHTKREVIEYKELSYDTIEEILNLGWKNMFGNPAESIPPVITKALFTMAEQYGVEPKFIKVYIVANEKGTDCSLHVFNGKQYIAETSLHDLITLAIMPQG